MMSQWKKFGSVLMAGVVCGLVSMVTPRLVSADIVDDIRSGQPAPVAAQKAVVGGMDPVAAAMQAAGAEPQSVVQIAAAIAKEAPESAKDVAAALARVMPERAPDIAREVVKLYPELAGIIVAAVIQQICTYDSLKLYSDTSKNLQEVCSAGQQVIVAVLTVVPGKEGDLYAALSGVAGNNAFPAIEAYEERGSAAARNAIPTRVMQQVIQRTPARDRIPASRI